MNGASALTFLREFLATLKIWVAKSTKHAERPIGRFFVANMVFLTKQALGRRIGCLLTRIESSDKLGLLDWSFTRIPRF